MSYELVFDEEAIRFLEKLHNDVRKRIFERISRAKDDPSHFFGRLEGRKEYRLRIGDYRAIADIENRRITVLFIGHRKNVYEKDR